MVLGIRERTGRSVTPKTDRTAVEILYSQQNSCVEGRGQNMRGSGQDTMRNDQIQRASVYMMYKEHISCRNYEPAVV
jgi:hypothetical protein